VCSIVVRPVRGLPRKRGQRVATQLKNTASHKKPNERATVQAGRSSSASHSRAWLRAQSLAKTGVRVFYATTRSGGASEALSARITSSMFSPRETSILAKLRSPYKHAICKALEYTEVCPSMGVRVAKSDDRRSCISAWLARVCCTISNMVASRCFSTKGRVGSSKGSRTPFLVLWRMSEVARQGRETTAAENNRAAYRTYSSLLKSSTVTTLLIVPAPYPPLGLRLAESRVEIVRNFCVFARSATAHRGQINSA
jgi:hypothetical protein